MCARCRRSSISARSRVGVASSESPITVTNSGNAALAISGIRTGTGDFLVGTNGCTPGASLAPGASCTFGVLARLASAGDRSDEVTIDTSEGPYRVPLDATGVGAPQPPAQALAPNFEGSWWTAPAGSESGWGLNFAHQGDVIFATVFTYDATGKTWWLSMTANRIGNNVFSGTLYETRGPAFNTVPFDSKAVAYHAVGTGTLDFSDANNGTFSYNVNGIAQSKPITRTVFGNLPICTASATQSDLLAATNYQDIWWAAAGTGETGWGLHFTHQGDIIFATWFTYDFDGSPLWLSATAQKAAPGVYSGTLYRTTGPAFGTVPFDPAKVVRSPVGNATLTFGNGDNATFAYSVTLGSPRGHRDADEATVAPRVPRSGNGAAGSHPRQSPRGDRLACRRLVLGTPASRYSIWSARMRRLRRMKCSCRFGT